MYVNLAIVFAATLIIIGVSFYLKHKRLIRKAFKGHIGIK